MHADVLRALDRAGVKRDVGGNRVLYHATPATNASLIVDELKLRPGWDPDPAVRFLQQREGGTVFLASSPDIAADLAVGEVVIELIVPSNIPAEISRITDSGRVELAVAIRPPSTHLDLVAAGVVDRAPDRPAQ